MMMMMMMMTMTMTTAAAVIRNESNELVRETKDYAKKFSENCYLVSRRLISSI